MDKTSITFVPRRMEGGGFKPNAGPLWAGPKGRLGIRVERVENLYEFVRAPCELVLYEVDGKGRVWSGKRSKELARFEVKIRREGTKFFFTMDKRLRLTADGKKEELPDYSNVLPAAPRIWEHWYQQPWKLKEPRPYHGPWDECDINLSPDFASEWMPDWLPAHLFVDFNTAGNTFDKESCVVIPSTCRQEGIHRRRAGLSVVDYFFTVGFEVFVGDELKYRSTTQLVDCHNLLAHNLSLAARGMLYAHEEGRRRSALVVFGPHPMLEEAGLPAVTGTHFGTAWAERLATQKLKRKFYYSFAQGKRTVVLVPPTPTIRGLTRDMSLVPLQFTSCMQYLLDVGEMGYAKTFGAKTPVPAGARPSNSLWKQLLHNLPRKGAEFGTIAKKLAETGWISVFFMPDTVEPRWAVTRPGRTYHLKRAQLALREPGTYDGIRIHDRLLDYNLRVPDGAPPGTPPRSLPPAQTARIAQQLQMIKDCEFAFAITSGCEEIDGRVRYSAHCAMLIEEKIYQVHWDHGPDASDLFANDVSFKDWDWSSGLLVLPRGQWKVLP